MAGTRLLKITRGKCDGQQISEFVDLRLIFRIEKVNVEIEAELGKRLPTGATGSGVTNFDVTEEESLWS